MFLWDNHCLGAGGRVSLRPNICSTRFSELCQNETTRTAPALHLAEVRPRFGRVRRGQLTLLPSGLLLVTVVDLSQRVVTSSTASLPPTSMSTQLTEGICMKIARPTSEDDEGLSETQPIVQILSLKKVPTTGASGQVDRYRLIISDGAHFVQAMLATQLNALVENETITKLAVLQLDKWTVNMVQNKRYARRFFVNDCSSSPLI